MDPVIGQVGRIAADSGLLGPLVDARTITLIGVAFVADTHLQITVCRHEAQTAERPLVDVAEAADRLERRLITGLPAGILVVGRELDHTEGHPRSGSDHPPRMGRADARIDIVGQGLHGLRGPFDASGGHLATVAQHPVTARPVASHGRHRHLEARAARLDAPAESSRPSTSTLSIGAASSHSTSTSSGCTRLPSRSSSYGAAATSRTYNPSGCVGRTDEGPSSATRSKRIHEPSRTVTRTVLPPSRSVPRRSGISSRRASHARSARSAKAYRRSAPAGRNGGRQQPGHRDH